MSNQRFFSQSQEKRIRDELEKVAVDHDARMDAFVSRVREKVQAEARWQQLQKDQTKGVSAPYLSLSKVGEMLCLDVFGKKVDLVQGYYFEGFVGREKERTEARWQQLQKN